jgi:hypothetical protein
MRIISRFVGIIRNGLVGGEYGRVWSVEGVVYKEREI